MLKIALIGRPNVGKSTLFNRIVGKKLAIVDDQPGVTRDLREGDAKILGVKATILDTAGIEDKKDGSLQARMRALTEKGIELSDICLFMIDARTGITSLDQDLARILRKSGKEIILIANKAEGRAGEAGYHEAFRLGLGEPIALSAEHGEGLDELYQVLLPILDQHSEDSIEETSHDDEVFDPDAEFVIDKTKPVRVAIVGRPNAGKSTLVNAILGEDRLLTGPEAGITRDSISFDVDWLGRKIKIFDTAGMRKRAKVVDKVEGLSVGDGIRAVKFAEVVVILLDTHKPFEQQDLRIADLCEREGRAVVIAVNKWDEEPNKSGRKPELLEMFERLLPQLRGAPLVTISARTGRGLDKLHKAIEEVYETWNARIQTAKLNRWLEGEVAHHPPPAPGGRRIKIRYMTQIKSRPPTFAIKCSRADDLPDSYRRYLVNGLRNSFDLWGVPLRLNFRSDDNPYHKKGRRKIG